MWTGNTPFFGLDVDQLAPGGAAVIDSRTPGYPASSLKDVPAGDYSGQQFEAWEAVNGPVGEDGYLRPLWDKKTGKIDKSVAAYMRDHEYDLAAHLKTNWAVLGPKLEGKLHVRMMAARIQRNGSR